MRQQVQTMGQPGKRSVQEASGLLKRLYWIERETMRALAGYVPSVADWELKKLLPRHIWRASLRADALRSRVLEMRYPRRDVDTGHDPALQTFLDSLIKCRSDAELLTGVYTVVGAELAAAYEAYLLVADPLDDAPTVAFMREYPQEVRALAQEAGHVLRRLTEREATADEAAADWEAGLRAWLRGLGGLTGSVHAGEEAAEMSRASSIADANGVAAEMPAWMAQRPGYSPPLVPKRDPSFPPAVFQNPPRLPDCFISRQIGQGINHVNEIWAAEITALVLWTWSDMPWEFYLNCARWSYDESRHCLMGEQRLRAWSMQAGVHYPVVGDHYISVSHRGELDILALLHMFESNGPNWKSGLKAEYEAAGDTASSQDFDYDWADESIHLQYGHKWLLHRLNGDIDALEELMQDTYREWLEWYDRKSAEWDYEPYLSRLEREIARLSAEQRR